MTVQFTLAQYRDTLADAESAKPVAQRRAVPTISELTEHLGITRQGYIGFASGQNRFLDLEKVNAVIGLFRARGFNTDINDLLLYYHEETK